MEKDPSSSAARRKALRQADSKINVFKVMETIPVDKYYSLIDNLLVAFDKAMDERRLDEAYIYGIRFASFCVESLPKHANYNFPEYKRLQLRNARQVDRVLKGLENVTARMDAEELAKKKRAEEEDEDARKEKKVETQKQQKESREEFDIEEIDSRRRKEVQHSALAKLKALQVESDRDVAKQEAKSRAEEEAILERERKRIAEQADWLLAQQEREKQASQQRQEQKNEVLTAKHAAQTTARAEEEAALEKEQKRIAQVAERLAQQQQRQQASLEEKPRYMLSREYETIQLLEQTIKKQEARLVLLERGMAMLLHEAKLKHNAGERKAAIHCMARRKRLECNMEAVKGAIFTMETQILMMEAAASDRQVSKAMKAVSQAMESLHVNVGDEVLVFDSNQFTDEIAQSIANDVMYDEDDLLSELEASTHVADVAVDADLLSLPSLPTNKVPETHPEKRKTEPTTKLVSASLF
jgi:hypothetical protein